MRRPRRSRGQGTVEAALGLLLVTSVLVFGIHFSEVAILSLKVQEAAASAMWDATAMKTGSFVTQNPDFSPRAGAIAAATGSAATRYTDFDGRQSNGGTGTTMVFTQAGGVTVTCTPDNSLPPLVLPNELNFYTPGNGGVVCSARATFNLVPGFATSFLGGGELFREQNAQVFTYPICSTGRAQGGACPATTYLLLGDWGFTDGTEALNCEQTAAGVCQNLGYLQIAERVWNNHGGPLQNPGGGERFLRFLFQNDYNTYFPAIMDESAFLMSAAGEDAAARPYTRDNPGGEHRGSGPYVVTPGGQYAAPLDAYDNADSQRDRCVFGFRCNAGSWPQYP